MWEPILFGLLTTYVVWQTHRRGDKAAFWSACALAIVWIGFTATGFLAPLMMNAQDAYRLQGEIGGALDAAAGVAAVCIWVVSYRVWPLGLMLLFMIQIAAHRWQAGAADTYAHRILTWGTIDALNLCQLALVRFGPDAHVLTRILRRLPRALGLRGRTAVGVRTEEVG